MYEAQDDTSDGNVLQKKKRGFYYKLPMFIRAKLYYWYRYYIQLGFLDGKEGKVFIFMQAYWYRFLVDSKIYEQMNGVGRVLNSILCFSDMHGYCVNRKINFAY